MIQLLVKKLVVTVIEKEYRQNMRVKGKCDHEKR